MSPLEIIILLHYYACPDDIANMQAPAVLDAVQRFVDLGLLVDTHPGMVPQPGEAKYAAGPALAVYVAALQAIPLPVQQWVIPQQGG